MEKKSRQESKHLKLRSFTQMQEENFVVPAYQRGYRWTPTEVRALLDDVYEFTISRERSSNSFYCLQPVVVARHAEYCELIDGQQRLTTMYLILKYINDGYAESRKKKLFKISYSARRRGDVYLMQPAESTEADDIDSHHIRESFREITHWFKDKDHLLGDLESAWMNHVKVIWYEVDTDIRSVEVFTRLNMGKIPLTNAELVKALFLRARNFDGHGQQASHLQQLRIAQEWDDMEKRLQDDAFWFFLSNEKIETNRIEFLLRIRAEELSKSLHWTRETQKDFVFLVFNAQLDRGVDVVSEWQHIKRLFLLLDEWYKDNELYHLVGFRVFQPGSDEEGRIAKTHEKSLISVSKTAFRRELKNDIYMKLFGSKPNGSRRESIEKTLAELSYDSPGSRVRSVLLLFNLVSLIQSSNSRFPFDFFKNDHWDIEHIRSVKSSPPERVDAQRLWLDHLLDYLAPTQGNEEPAPATEDDEKLRMDAQSLRTTEPFDSEEFISLFERVIERYDPHSNPDADNGIGNLTLLDATTNRSYKNAIFPIKRIRIIGLDKIGQFVPLCTKNAFLKYYSPSIKDMLVWTKFDSGAHQEAMVDTLAKFFEADREE